MDEKKKRGGIRENAGRKPKLKDDARSLFYARVDEKWDQIMEALDYWIAKKDKDMLKLVIEQRIGKAPQSVEVEVEITLKIDM